MASLLTALLFSHPAVSPTCSPSFLINAHPLAVIYFGLTLLVLHLFEMSLPAWKSLLCSACPLTPSSCYQILLKFCMLIFPCQPLHSPLLSLHPIMIQYILTLRIGENCLSASSDDFRQGFHMQDIYSKGNASQAFSSSHFSTFYSVLALDRPVILIPCCPALYF